MPTPNQSRAAATPRPYPQRQGNLPTEIGEITAATIQALLRNKYPGISVTGLEAVKIITGHTAKMRLKLQYGNAGDTAGPPEYMCLKGNFSGRVRQDDIHALEAQFYHFIKDAMNIPAPELYYADWDGGGRGQGLILIEDLEQRGGRFGHSTDHLGIGGVAQTLKAFARLHANSWNDPLLDQFSWLHHSMQTPVDHDQVEMMWFAIEKNRQRKDYRPFMPAWAREDKGRFQRLYASLVSFARAQKGPRCLVHGDGHQGNTYVDPDGSRIFLDWQLVRKGQPWRDITYFMVAALTVEERRAAERDLLAFYRNELVTAGAAEVASLAEIWENYRRWPIYGAQAWLQNNDDYGQVSLPGFERSFTAMADLETVRALEG